MATLVVPATLQSLEPIRRFVAEAGEAAGLDKTAAYNLTLALDEVATNIILYGYAGYPGEPEIRLGYEVTDATLSLDVEDRGVPYDPMTRTMVAEELNKPLEERAIGGLGVYLALQSVDHFEYQRIDDRNLNRFVMNRPR